MLAELSNLKMIFVFVARSRCAMLARVSGALRSEMSQWYDCLADWKLVFHWVESKFENRYSKVAIYCQITKQEVLRITLQ